MNPTRRTTLNFALLGVAFGLCFPIISTIIETLGNDLPLTLSNMLQVQKESVLLWVIDSAPLIIGILAALIGLRQARLQELFRVAEERYQEELKLKNEISLLNQDLENRVQERTKEVEKRSSYIEAAAEIGRAATSIYKLDELLPRVVDLISAKFDFYQAGIFLLDDQNEFAVMRAASSEGGKRMLARDHRLKVGQEGIVGYVTSTGNARIALDVGQDAVHFNTPELPQTRSEMALPLFYGGQILGALDVQSDQPNAFTDQDISALNVLADQVSMAISNALLFEDLESSMESERRTFEKATSAAWQNLVQQSGTWGFKFTNNRIISTKSQWPEEMIQALKENKTVRTNPQKPTLNVPIKIGDETIGVIRLTKEEGQFHWTEDEIDLIQILSERLSQALESARLFQATQKQAVQEQITSDISTQLRQTLDIDTVLKTAAKQLGDAFNAKEVVIRMAPNEPKNI